MARISAALAAVPRTDRKEPTVAWWLWVAGGLALLCGELLMPGGFYLLFFGIAALIVGVVVALGIPLPLYGQGAGFVGLAAAAVLLLRVPSRAWLQRARPGVASVDSIVGAEAVAREAILPDSTGSVVLHGAEWPAHNADLVPIPSGARCYVSAVVGVTLTVSQRRAQ